MVVEVAEAGTAVVGMLKFRSVKNAFNEMYEEMDKTSAEAHTNEASCMFSCCLPPQIQFRSYKSDTGIQLNYIIYAASGLLFLVGVAAVRYIQNNTVRKLRTRSASDPQSGSRQAPVPQSNLESTLRGHVPVVAT
jgi:hypothetical protein